MSNKPHEKLNPLDRELRKLFPTEMWENDEIICTIDMIGGFEYFNTRPYHNYENWSSGYRIMTGERFEDKYGKSVVVSREDLDEAIAAFVQEVNRVRQRYEGASVIDLTLPQNVVKM